ncbi:dihydrofolate reductase family protein [Kribbella sp. NBC_01245]|uniref:dihydrofolate reductase family protein n=1 Tax=Kribbella sp. NBC_01245 TaxID=2903578 RepID=UPI002E2AEE64|nr:dihydrofolate reductase family protein [Kribbella sp. NBC_01245]
MREIVNSTYISLDGIVEHPETWPGLGGFSDEGNKVQAELIQSCSAVLMGRHTYESFAGVWPILSGDTADKMNSMPKYVASTTLTDPAWNNAHVIQGDLVAAVEQLKEEPGDDIVQYGFGPVTRTLIAAGLLDRLRLWVHPFFVGHGGTQDLLYRDTGVTRFNLVNTTALSSGIVILDYRIRAEN